MGYAAQIGFPGAVLTRGATAVAGLGTDLVYAGFSLGVLPAQQLAQTRAGARGALLFYSCVPVAEFGGWPAGSRCRSTGWTRTRCHRPSHPARPRLPRKAPRSTRAGAARALSRRELQGSLVGHQLGVVD
jgi:hypothetical protein